MQGGEGGIAQLQVPHDLDWVTGVEARGCHREGMFDFVPRLQTLEVPGPSLIQAFASFRGGFTRLASLAQFKVP
jgi:hypothetical protein